MPRVFEQINERVSLWYDALSERERKLLGILAFILVSLLIISSITLASTKLSNKNAKLTKSKSQLDEIMLLETEYLTAKQKHEDAVKAINRNKISLFVAIPSIATRLGLAVGGLEEKTKPILKTDMVEVSVNLSLQKLSVDKLNALIEGIETYDDSNQIKITRLKITKSFETPDLLNVEMTVATKKKKS